MAHYNQNQWIERDDHQPGFIYLILAVTALATKLSVPEISTAIKSSSTAIKFFEKSSILLIT